MTDNNSTESDSTASWPADFKMGLLRSIWIVSDRSHARKAWSQTGLNRRSLPVLERRPRTPPKKKEKNQKLKKQELEKKNLESDQE